MAKSPKDKRIVLFSSEPAFFIDLYFLKKNQWQNNLKDGYLDISKDIIIS
jgi:hypothetical protein